MKGANHSLIRIVALLSMGFLMILCSLSAMDVIPSLASGFVGSIEQKGAPDVESITDPSGKDVSNEIIVTPYVKRETMSPEKIEDFENAYHSVDVDNITEIVNKGIQDKKIPIPERWKSGGVNLKPEDITITDVFYVHKKNDLTEPELPVKITMKSPVSPNRLLVVLYYDGKKWVVVPSTRDGDKVTFYAYKYGTYMFVSNTVLEKAGKDDPSSPQTGYDDEW